ncbi:hypothetical protein EO244_12980 [Ancylomarina salipaludis]|uniref:Uncharacterized protein n=1 Tax=Ancylomarina salipaludis TaxID=2501299 RepID=A0A4Q1JJD9_9BACT|nr:hypothetical protein [Ancylomarina salipaludis]RXQ91011.1 hypothetical protein EO244_12980 [Ancylomarina salipaludis]
MLLTKKLYSDWTEIQGEYEDYMASLDFNTLNEIEEYIRVDYKLTANKAKQEVNKINIALNDTIEIEL